jgi:putative hemolysin
MTERARPAVDACRLGAKVAETLLAGCAAGPHRHDRSAPRQRSPAEIAAAQEVRYRVFHEELGARLPRRLLQDRRDADRFDDVCDHLLVIDTCDRGAGPSQDRRHLSTAAAGKRRSAAGGFYSSDEFEMEALVARHPTLQFLELGRSCVLAGLSLAAHDRASVAGHLGLCEPPWHRRDDRLRLLPSARCRRRMPRRCRSWRRTAAPTMNGMLAQCLRATTPMDLMPTEVVNARSALAAMPPLIKGYLRLGAKIGDGCVVDHDFGTTDVFIVLPVETISSRYINYYGADATRFAA